MKLFAITAAAAALSSTLAIAADVISEAPVAPVAEAVEFYDWTGAYIGAQAGYAWNKVKSSAEGSTEENDVNGAFAGGYLGYNFLHNGPWVAGVEGDFVKDWADKKFVDVDGNSSLEYKWSASVRARAGYAFDRTFVYGTAGWAVTKIEVQSSGPEGLLEKETFNGWTVGAGFEQALTDNVIGRVEYRYADFGKKTYGDGKSELDKHTVGAGVSWKF